MDDRKLAEIAIPLYIDKIFHYLIPPKLFGRLSVGVRVTVPFGRRTITGYLVGFPAPEGSEEVAALKEIVDITDFEPSFTPAMLKFYRWISEYYISPLGIVISSALPAKGGKAKRIKVVLPGDASKDASVSKRGREILSFIRERGSVSLSEVRETLGTSVETIKRMAEKGLLVIREETVLRTPALGSVVRSTPPDLTPAQHSAFDSIRSALEKGGYSPFLLHGVTGSGKTEVYMQAIGTALKMGKGAIVMVPEISLTPQLISRFRSRFGDTVASLHSAMSEGERYDEWSRIRDGKARIVVGARSAIFSPMPDLGIIIVDEEHDHSYKQEEAPRYNARDLSLVRGTQEGATVVLGSATPSLESHHNARNGRFGYLRLPDRVEGRPMPEIKVVDMRESGKKQILSGYLTERIKNCLGKEQQALLFLNRRGYSTFLLCPDCGHSLGCPNCSISLIYHKEDNSLRCHYCDYSQKAFPVCPRCGSGEVKPLGFGTERVEKELKELFPSVRVARMDRDSVSRKGSHERILRMVETGEVDILVGTQMITKGHDYPNISLVGVLSADLSLNIPDFRAAERTYQLITQVAGRAGRGDKGGEVVIQTYNPDHYSIVAASRHNWEGFSREEISFRKELAYPPFTRIINVRLRGNSEARVAEAAGRLDKTSRIEGRSFKGVEVLGPSRAPLYKIRGKFRWQMMIKGKDPKTLHTFLRNILLKTDLPNGVDVQPDVDPINML